MRTRSFQSRVWRLLWHKLRRLGSTGRCLHQLGFSTDKILSILPFSKPCVYTWGIDVEMVSIDGRRIATGVLYERMKHIAGCDLRLYVDVCKGAQDAACHPVKLLTDRARGRLRRDNTVI